MPITPAQFLEMLQRVDRNAGRAPVSEDAVESELGLHDEVEAYCRENRFAYIHSRTDKRTTIGVGAPDFLVLAKGKVVLLELKSRTGKLRPEQMGWALQAEMNGFKVAVCRNMAEVLEAFSNNQSSDNQQKEK